MDSGGGAVVVAAGSEVRVKEFVENSVTYPVHIRSWFRLYSDGWLEQGSSKPFAEFTNYTPSQTAEEKYETIDLFIPYDDTSFEIQMTMWDIIPSIYNDTQVQAASKTYKSFNACQGGMNNAQSSAHIRTYGGVNWRTSGYVSQETLKQVLAGKGWNPVTESWGGVEYVINLSDGTKTLTLQPGNYTLFMCGAGHDFGRGTGSSYAFTDIWSGGAGGTICAKFTLDSSMEVNASVGANGTEFYDTGRNAIDLLCSNASEKIGGTNTVTTFLGTITKNVPGENANTATVSAGGYGSGTAVDIVNSELHKILGVNNGCSGSGTFGPNYSETTYSLGQPGLIRLLMETE